MLTGSYHSSERKSFSPQRQCRCWRLTGTFQRHASKLLLVEGRFVSDLSQHHCNRVVIADSDEHGFVNHRIVDLIQETSCVADTPESSASGSTWSPMHWWVVSSGSTWALARSLQAARLRIQKGSKKSSIDSYWTRGQPVLTGLLEFQQQGTPALFKDEPAFAGRPTFQGLTGVVLTIRHSWTIGPPACLLNKKSTLNRRSDLSSRT